MQNTTHNKAQTEVTTQSVFGLKYASNNLCLNTESKYKPNEKVTSSLMQFHRRFLNKVDDLFDDYDWSNTIIAGGLISGMMEARYQASEYEMSDVDIFVYGSKTTVIDKIQQIYDYFLDKLDKKFYAFTYGISAALLNIVIPGKFSIQIIGTLFKSELDVLKSFDMTHCQVGYNGNEIVHTDGYIKAIKTMTTSITTRSIHAYRLVKAYHRGYSIERPTYCYIKNIFHEYTQRPDKKYPDNTDKDYDINNLQYLIHELEDNPIVVQNLTKNYIPPLESALSPEEEMEKLGTLYVGKGKGQYEFVCSPVVFVSDIKHLIGFVRIPFPA